jgi:hypothetical protein
MTTTGTGARTWHHNVDIGGVPYPLRTLAPDDLASGDYKTYGSMTFAPDQGRRMAAAHELGHLLTARHFGLRMDSLTLGASLDGEQHQVSGSFIAAHHADQPSRDLAVMFAAGERAANLWLFHERLWTPVRAMAVELMADRDRTAAAALLPAVTFDGGPDDYSHLHDAADRTLSLYWDRLTTALDTVVTRDQWTGDEIAALAGLDNPVLAD